MKVLFKKEFKKELAKLGGNIIISGISFEQTQIADIEEFEITEQSLNTVTGSKNGDTLDTYFEIPQGLKNIHSIVYYWNKGWNEGETDSFSIAFSVVSDEEISFSDTRNLISIALPENSIANIVFITEGDFKFLEISDPFRGENLSRTTVADNKTISPESFYHESYSSGRCDKKKVDYLGRGTTGITTTNIYKELIISCDSTIEHEGKTVRYGLYQDVKDGSVCSQYFQGVAKYDRYIYNYEELIGIEENLEMPISEVTGIRLIAEIPEKFKEEENIDLGEFTVDNNRFCVDYTRMKDIAYCVRDVHAEVDFYKDDEYKTIKSNTIRITQQDEEVSFTIIEDSEKYYKTTIEDKTKYGAKTGSTVVIVEPTEKVDKIVIHSVEDEITEDNIKLEYGDEIDDAFEIEIISVNVEKRNITLSLKIKSVEGYVYKGINDWYPLKKFTEEVEPWLFPVTLTCNDNSFTFYPVIKNTYTADTEIITKKVTNDNDESVRESYFYIKGNKNNLVRGCFGIAYMSEGIVIKRKDGEVISDGRLDVDTIYTASGVNGNSVINIYQADRYITDYENNTDWKNEISTYIYKSWVDSGSGDGINISTLAGLFYAEIKEDATKETGIYNVTEENMVFTSGVGVYKVVVNCNQACTISLSSESTDNVYLYNNDTGELEVDEDEVGKDITIYIVVSDPSTNLFKLMAQNKAICSVYLTPTNSLRVLNRYLLIDTRGDELKGKIYFNCQYKPSVFDSTLTELSITPQINITDVNGIPVMSTENQYIEVEFTEDEIKAGKTIAIGKSNNYCLCYIAAQSYIDIDAEEPIIIPAEITISDKFIDGTVEIKVEDEDQIKVVVDDDITKITLTNISDEPEKVDTRLIIETGISKTLMNLSGENLNGTGLGVTRTYYQLRPNNTKFIKKISDKISLYGETDQVDYLGETITYTLISDSELPEDLKITFEDNDVNNLVYSEERKKLDIIITVPSRVLTSDCYCSEEGYERFETATSTTKEYTATITTENKLVNEIITIEQEPVKCALVLGTGNEYPIAVTGKYSGASGNLYIKPTITNLLIGVIDDGLDYVRFNSKYKIVLKDESGEEFSSYSLVDGGESEFKGKNTSCNIEDLELPDNCNYITVHLYRANGTEIAKNKINLVSSNINGPKQIAFMSDGTLISGPDKTGDGYIELVSSEELTNIAKDDSSNFGLVSLSMEKSNYENTYNVSLHAEQNNLEEKEGNLVLTIGEDAYSIAALQGYYSAFYSLDARGEYSLINDSEIIINKLINLDSELEYSNPLYLMIFQREYNYENNNYVLGEKTKVDWNNEPLCNLVDLEWKVEIGGEEKNIDSYLENYGIQSDSVSGDHLLKINYKLTTEAPEEFTIKITGTLNLKYPTTSSLYSSIQKDITIKINHEPQS